MKKTLKAYFLIVLIFSCKNSSENNFKKTAENLSQTNQFAIVIHGGAGTILKENMSPEKEAAYKDKLKEAIQVGYHILKNGGTSIDAVEETIIILENSPLFNAGKGAVFTNAETNELDASIMNGKDLNAGASAGTTIVKNPISLARKIMENSPHVMMVQNGAESYAKEQGLEIVDPIYFQTKKRLNSLKRIKDKEEKKEVNNNSAFYDNDIKDSKFGTVGCVALDKKGNLAAGTSTGGMTNKRWGRIGDSPIIGAGTYANNNTCAVSSTGWGEFFIRAMVAHDISALMEYKGLTLREAAQEVIQKKVPELGDKNGNMVMEFNTAGMYRATINDKGEMSVNIYKN